MNLSTEAKVGLVSAVGLVILGWMLIWVGHIDFGPKGRTVEAVFRYVDGLVEGNPVRYAGVDVGRVTRVSVNSKGVIVKMQLKPGVTIPEGSKFTITSMGLLGEKFLEIIPNPLATRDLADGERVEGIDPQRLEDLFAAAEKLVKDMQKLVNNVNDVVGSEEAKNALKKTILNLQAITGNLEVFTASLQRLAVYSEQDAIAMVQNLHGVSVRLLSVSEQADLFMRQFAADGKTGQELRDAVAAIQRTAQAVEKMSVTLEKEVTDPQTIKSLKETLQNVHQASERANKLLGRAENFKLAGGAEVLGARGAYQTNLDVRFGKDSGFLQVGVNDIGEGDKANLQIGKQSGDFTARVGIFDGKAGFGLDQKLGGNTKLSVEVCDPNDTKVKLRGEYYLGNDGAFVIQKSDIKDSQQPTFLGIRKNF